MGLLGDGTLDVQRYADWSATAESPFWLLGVWWDLRGCVGRERCRGAGHISIAIDGLS